MRYFRLECPMDKDLRETACHIDGSSHTFNKTKMTDGKIIFPFSRSQLDGCNFIPEMYFICNI